MASSLIRTVAIIAATLAFCAAAHAQSVGDRVEAGGITFEALPPQELQAGECGLFLWSKGTRPVFFLVAYDAPAIVYVRDNGRPRRFNRSRFGGELVSGFFERQTFVDGDITLQLEIEFDEQRQIADGALIKQGVVRVTDKKGWRSIVPVTGIVGCKT